MLSESNSRDIDFLNSLQNPDFLLHLAFLTDITKHFNNPNLVLQGRNKNICVILKTFNEFSTKLEKLADQMSSKNLSNFPNNSSIFINFTHIDRFNVFSEEINKPLKEFRSRFQDVHKIEWVVEVYENPLNYPTGNIPGNIRIELLIMREDLCIPMETGIQFWKNSCNKKYSVTRNLILYIFFQCFPRHTYVSRHFLQWFK